MAIILADVYYNFKYFLKNKFPPFYFFVRACRGYLFFPANIIHQAKWPKFYSQFINRGDLCFDIGAHNGRETDIFLKLGARVIAVEPQPLCREITKTYGSNKNLIVINKGLADKPGCLTLTINDDCDSISTMSEKWKKESRFSADYKWANIRLISVPVVTLDSLIIKYGRPKFCKIDVEGFEKEVLRGLTRPIPYISFEFMKEFLGDAKSCIDYLTSLGSAKFNFSIAESTRLFFKDWVSPEELFSKLEQIENRDLWGDIYVGFFKDT